MDETPKIERGIPIPRPGTVGGRWVTQLRAMQVGDSFRTNILDRASLRQSCTHEQRRGPTPMRFVCRTVYEYGARYFRVWRVE